MPENLDFVLYFNIAFFGIIGLGVLSGLLRGLKKTLFSFVTMAIFYAVFFLTIDMVVNQLWTINVPQMGALLSNVDPAFAGVSSFQGAVPIALNLYGGSTIDPQMLSPEVMNLINGLGIFVVKIVYTILYFTVILIIYKFICWLIRVIFFGGKKDARAAKNGGFGAIFGLLNGVMALFVFLIMFGGIMSMVESISTLAGSIEPEPVELEFPRQHIYQASYSVIPLEDPAPDPTGMDELLGFLNEALDAYKTNVLVQAVGSITISNEAGTAEVPLNLYLFDSVLSFEFSEQKVSIRNEMAVFAAAAKIFMDSEFATTSDIADLKGDEIRDVFALLSGSNFVVAALPVGVEFAADFYDVDLGLTPEALAAINWATELSRLGVIAGSMFDILNGAGIIAGTGDVETIEVDGDAIRDLFNSMGDSQLVLLACETFVGPYLSDPENEVSAFLTIPADLNWETEFPAIGEALGAIFDDSGDFVLANLGLETVANLTDTTIDKIFESQILVATISTVLSTQDLGTTTLIIPDAVYDLNGYLTKTELAALAKSVKLVATTVGDTTEFDAANVLDLTGAQIDTLLSSQIIAATMGKLISDMGTDVLIIPPSSQMTVVVDTLNVTIVSAVEIKKVFEALALLDIAQFDDVEFTASIIDNFESTVTPGTLDDAKLTTLFASEILHATISDMLLDLTAGAGSFVAVPYKDVNDVVVRTTVGTIEYISVDELKNALEALYALGVADFANVDSIGLASIITNQAVLFDSAILHATISKQLFDLGESAITIPYFDENGVSLRITVGEVGFQTTYLKRTELEAIFDALDVLNLTDIGTFSGTVDLSIVSEGDNANTLLSSAIIQATISEQVLGMGSTLTVPFFAEDGTTEIRISVGAGLEATEYISKAELGAVIDALDVLGLTDLETFSGTVNLATLNTGTNSTILLSSSIIHSTISDQVLGLDESGTIDVPYVAEDGTTEIRKVVGGVGETTEYVAKDELEAIFDGLQVLEITDLETFSGTISLAVITIPANTTILLGSSIIQATISKQMIDLPDEVLLVPIHKQDGTTLVRTTVGDVGKTTEYVTKDEIEKLLNAFNIMGIADLDSTGVALASGEFFNNAATLLESSSIQATISDKMLNGTGGVLIIPDEDALANDIRIVQADVTYIDAIEIQDIITALDEMGLTDFTTMDFTPATIFASDYATILNSASMQATFSNTILGFADDESAADGSAVLIVPNAVREDIVVNGLTVKQIELTELVHMLDSLDMLGILNFDTNFDPAVIMTMDETELDAFLDSGSIHNTLNKMLKGNVNVSGYIPSQATETMYPLSLNPIPGVVEKDELIDFILAVQVLGGGSDFTNVTLNPVTIVGLNAANRSIVLQSMIVRNAITDPVEILVAAKNADNFPGGPFFTLDAEDYEENDDNLFFTYLDAIEIMKFLNDDPTFVD
jgi:hypothetical protein